MAEDKSAGDSYHSRKRGLYDRSERPGDGEECYRCLSGESDHPHFDSSSYGGDTSNIANVSHKSFGFNTAAATTTAADQITFHHGSKTHLLQFPAFSIGDGKVYIGDIRASAAALLHISDPRDLEIVYRGRKLGDDSVSCRQEGLKRNSEIFCQIVNRAASLNSNFFDKSRNVPRIQGDSLSAKQEEISASTKTPPTTLLKALDSNDYSIVHDFLKKDFEAAATSQFGWLHELRETGYTIKEITELLLEDINDSP